MEMLVGIIVGVTTGSLSSLIAWWISYRLLAPNIAFSPQLKKARTENAKTGYYYQFKIGNLKKHTSAIDIAFRVTLYLPDFPLVGVTNMYSIPTASTTIFELSPKKDGSTGWNRRLSLQINNKEFVKNFDKTYFSNDLKTLGESEMLTLEDLLSITPGSFIRIHASAANSYSGSRRLFKSKDYQLSDVVEGKYERFSLELKAEDTSGDYFKSSSGNDVITKDEVPPSL